MIRKILSNIIAMVAKPAKNFPLIKESRKIGWDKIMLIVPWERSELMASKPKIIPINGPKKPIKKVNEGSDPADEMKNPRRVNSTGIRVKFSKF